MVDTTALIRIGDSAEDAGNLEHAREAFERGAAIDNADCLCRLAYLFDTGKGVEAYKAIAMRLYPRAWRKERNVAAGLNIAILYRERKGWRTMFRYFQRVAETGDGSGLSLLNMSET